MIASDFSRCSVATRCGHGMVLIMYALQPIVAPLVLCSSPIISFGKTGVASRTYD